MANTYRGIDSISQARSQSHKVTVSAGLWFGLLFGLSYAIFTWGWDAWLLSSSGATLAWGKLLFGLPLTLLLGGLAGRFVAVSPYAGVVVLTWAILGGLFSILAGHLPFEGRNLAIWLTRPDLRGEALFVFDYAAKIRTVLVTGINSLLGAFTGAVEILVIQWAWDYAKPDGRLSTASRAALFVGVPMALLMSLVVNGLINQPLRCPEQITGKLIQQANSGEVDPDSVNYRTIKPFMGRLDAPYRTHFVAFGGDKKSWHSAYVDAVFEDGTILRCVTSGTDVIYCGEFSEKFETWIAELARFGFSGERPWLEEPIQYLVVDDSVLTWLEAHAPRMSANYKITTTSPQNGWLIFSVRYDTGFEMTCRFRGAAPIIVDQCAEGETSAVGDDTP